MLSVLLPKGRINSAVVALLYDAGIELLHNGKNYRPLTNDKEITVKLIKPQNIPKIIELGSHDCGFTGYDWIVETESDVEQILDVELDSVKIVSAINKDSENSFARKKLVVVSEYENISRNYLNKRYSDYVFLKSYGATEVFPPDDADIIIDNISSGKTLEENSLKILDIIMFSSTRFIASRKSLENREKRKKIEEMELLFKSVLQARKRVILEMNVPRQYLSNVLSVLPAMRVPTISSLVNDDGYAVKSAVIKDEVKDLVPLLKKMGAFDILEYEIRKVVL